MKRPADAGASPEGGGDFSDPTWLKSLPHLCEYLTAVRYDDGTSRETSTLTVKSQDGRVLICINDRDLSRSLYSSGETVQDCLKSIEKHLGAGTGDWRAWMSSSSAGKRKRS